MAQTEDEYNTKHNYEHFRDALASVLITAISETPSSTSTKQSSKKKRPRPHHHHSRQNNTPENVNNTRRQQETPPPEANAEELADFIDYIATSIFDSLPPELQSINHQTWMTTSLEAQYSSSPLLPLTPETTARLLPTLDPSIPDSLQTYGFLPSCPDNTDVDDDDTLYPLLSQVLTNYIESASLNPDQGSSTTRGSATECEICGRDWINLTYHHLIPRAVHAKAVKRGWHSPSDLQRVAWLCGACHKYVHRFASHEDLARRYDTVEKLLAEDEIQKFASWVGRLRWKGR